MNNFYRPFVNNKKYLKKFLSHKQVLSLNRELKDFEMLEYNNLMKEYLYGLKNLDISQFKEKLRDDIENVNKKNIKIDITKYGIILVKPEMIGFEKQLIDFLENKGFYIEYNLPIKVNKKQFKMLYKRQIVSQETQFDMPSRMLNLINKASRILIVTNKSVVNCSDVLNQFKGKLGAFDDNTIRGFGAKLIDSVISKSTFKELSYIDPIQMCRGNVKYDFGKDDGAFKNLQNPLLFFIANCVHIPDFKELEEHTKILLSQRQINKFINTILC